MKTEEEVKKKISKAVQNKSNAKGRGSDIAYISNLRVEQALRWVLKD